MLDKLPSEVEKARIRIGAYASLPGGRSGAFLLKHPSGILLKVIASDGADWSQECLPGAPWEHVSVRSSASFSGVLISGMATSFKVILENGHDSLIRL